MGIYNALFTGASGLTAFGNAVSVVGDNIANVNSLGFKSQTVNFADVFGETVGVTKSNIANQVGNGVTIGSITRNEAQGSVQSTSTSTDFAINGEGLFVLTDPNRGTTVSSRAGAFLKDSSSNLVNAQGYQVQGWALDSAGNATGSVTSIFPQTNNDTRTVVVEALIDNPQGRLLSGLYLEMTLLTKSQSNTLSVPQAAMVEYNGEPSVWVMVGTTAERRTVETGMVNGDRVAITSGLNPGDQVITSGHSRLVPGVQVAMVDDAGEPVPMLGDSSQGSVEVAIVEPDSTQSFKSGGADLVLEVRDPDTQEPLPVEAVTVDVTMPMPNMAPMTTMVQFEPTGQPGRFQVKTHFGMVGEWQIKVEVNDPDYKGQALITVPVE